MDSNFFFPVTVHLDGISVTNIAQWVEKLPISPPMGTAVVTLFSTEGAQLQGMYLYDTQQNRWRYVIPYVSVCEAIINGSTLDLYTQVEATVTPGIAATIWRNGVQYSGVDVDTTPTVAWAVLTPVQGGGGTGSVTAVNNVGPDGSGNVSIGVSDIPGLETALANAAPINSPEFTGTPTAPTPGVGDNSTSIATTAFVQAALENGSVNTVQPYEFTATDGQRSFPVSFAADSFVEVFHNGGLLQTSDYETSTTGPVVLNTGANAGDDVKIIVNAPYSVADTVPVSGGTYSGLVMGVTPSAGDNSTAFATTAFVDHAISSVSGVSSFNTRSGAVVLSSADLTGVGGALLASPALTGTPTAPTATAGTNTTQLATTAFVTAAVASGTAGVSSFNTRTGAVTLSGADITGAGGALLVSPAFTGTPSAPTATAGTSTTQVATTAFVTSAVSTGVTGLAPLAAPTFTGIPAAPTATAGTNTTQVATTAFVQAAVSTGAVTSFNTRTGAVTLTAADVTSVGGALLASPTFTGVPAAPTAVAGTSSTQIATTAFVAASYAPLASPALTGTPTAPTATAGTNTTQVATTAFVTSAVAAGTAGVSSFNTRTGAVTLTAVDVTGVGGALLASPTFTGTPSGPTAAAGTSTTQLATTAFVATSYAPLVSPALSGTPTAPTATAGTNTTQLATTAFVASAVAAGSAGVSSFNTRTGAVTLTSADVTGVGGALLASPALTGTPTVPTAAVGTNSTQIADTAFVYAATQSTSSVALTNANVTLSAAQYSVPVVVVSGALTANVTLTFPTAGAWNVVNTTSGAFTVTLSNGSGATVVAQQGAVIDVVSSGASGMLPVQSNKVIGRLQSDSSSATVVAIGATSGTQTLDLSLATEWTMTITAATTFAFTNTLPTNQTEVVYLRLTNPGAGNITWPTGTQFANKTAPTFTVAGVDLLGVQYDTVTSTYMVFVIGQNIG